MFTLTVNNDLKLALVQLSFADRYYQIVSEQRDYLKQWLAWPEHADNVVFFRRLPKNLYTITQTVNH